MLTVAHAHTIVVAEVILDQNLAVDHRQDDQGNLVIEQNHRFHIRKVQDLVLQQKINSLQRCEMETRENLHRQLEEIVQRVDLEMDGLQMTIVKKREDRGRVKPHRNLKGPSLLKSY